MGIDPNYLQDGFIDEVVGALDRYSGGEEVVLQEKTITENGTYVADEGFDAMSKVIVEVASSGGDDVNLLDALIDGSITEVSSNAINIKDSAFKGCNKLTTVNMPNVTNIGKSAFHEAYNLLEIDFPLVVEIPSNAFDACRKLRSVNMPNVTSIDSYAFRYCYVIKTFDFPKLYSIGATATFNGCYSLTAFIIRSDTLVSASGKPFNACYHILGTTNSEYNPDGLADGYIYVPAALVDAYKAATNWSTYASQFRALEDYTVDGTITGALDESKI